MKAYQELGVERVLVGMWSKVPCGRIKQPPPSPCCIIFSDYARRTDQRGKTDGFDKGTGRGSKPCYNSPGVLKRETSESYAYPVVLPVPLSNSLSMIEIDDFQLNIRTDPIS